MGRGADLNVLPASSRNSSGKRSFSLDVNKDPHLQLLSVEELLDPEIREIIPSEEEMLTILEEIKKKFPGQKGVMDYIFDCVKEIRGGDELTSIERFFALHRILEQLNWEGNVLDLESLKSIPLGKLLLKTSQELEDKGLDPKITFDLYRLRTALPLLDLNTPSMQELKQSLEGSTHGDIEGYFLKQPVENFRDSSLSPLIEILALSVADFTPETERLAAKIDELLPLAQETSEMNGMKYSGRPLVVSEKVIKALLQVQETSGFCVTGFFGYQGLQYVVVVDLAFHREIIEEMKKNQEGQDSEYSLQELEEIYNFTVLRTLSHEMIHDIQDNSDGSTDWDKRDLREGLTEALNFLRLQSRAGYDFSSTVDDPKNKVFVSDEWSSGYYHQVEGVLSLLEEMKIPEEEREDFLVYLNRLPLEAALDLMKEMSARDDVLESLRPKQRIEKTQPAQKKRSLVDRLRRILGR